MIRRLAASCVVLALSAGAAAAQVACLTAPGRQSVTVLSPASIGITVLSPCVGSSKLPTHFALGLQNGTTAQLSWMTGSGVPWDYRFAYESESTDNAVAQFVSDSLMAGIIPVVTWYTAISSSFSTASLANTTNMNAEYVAYVAALKSMAGWAGWYQQRSGSSLITITSDCSSATYTGVTGTNDVLLAGNYHGTGKWAFRLHAQNMGGSGSMFFGLARRTSLVADSYLGSSAQSGGILGSGFSINNVTIGGSLGFAMSTGDDVDFAVDLTLKKLWYRRNAGNWNNIGGAVPGDANGVDISSLDFTGGATWTPAATLSANGDQVTFGTPPTITGFAAWNSSPATTAMIVDYEPDLFGLMQQQGGPSNAQTDDPTQVAVSVASSGYSGLGSLPNNAAGFAKALKMLRDTNAPNISLGWHGAWWASNNGFNPSSNPSNTLAASAGTRAGQFYNAVGAAFDLSYQDTVDKDAAAPGGNWWAAAGFESFRQYCASLNATSKLSLVLWQTPVGNTLYQASNNTVSHYQDDHVEFFLPPPAALPGGWPGNSPLYSPNNIRNYLSAGVSGVLFGTGSTNSSPYYNSGSPLTGGGYNPGALGSPGNPVNTNNNTAVATVSDDDGGFLRLSAGQYYAAPLPLPTLPH